MEGFYPDRAAEAPMEIYRPGKELAMPHGAVKI